MRGAVVDVVAIGIANVLIICYPYPTRRRMKQIDGNFDICDARCAAQSPPPSPFVFG